MEKDKGLTFAKCPLHAMHENERFVNIISLTPIKLFKMGIIFVLVHKEGMCRAESKVIFLGAQT